MNIYTGLLFQQGYIGDACLAQSLAAPAPPAPGCGPDDTRTRELDTRADRLRANEALARDVRRSTALSPFR